MIKYLKEAPPGFFYFPNFLFVEEENALIDQFKKILWEPVELYGVTARRRVKHYGLTYKFDNRSVEPTEPAPYFLDPLIQRAASLINHQPEEIAEILIIEYPVGAGIGWHRDAPVFGDKVFGISLAANCIMKLRNRANHSEIYKTELAVRSAYIISGPARSTWEHSVPAVKSPRYSITFRTLS